MNITIALAGNPNSGKTTLFNALTGSNQYVGNWPGVTVERKEARFRLRDDEALLVDLPGVYSLSPYSIEEDITRHFIAQHHPDIVLNIVDATSIERNLYFTLQLMELERPMVIALNQMDEVKRRGGFIDAERLSALLGIPVVPISAKRREGFDELFDAIHQQAHDQIVPMPEKLYDEATRRAILRITQALGGGDAHSVFDEPEHAAHRDELHRDDDHAATAQHRHIGGYTDEGDVDNAPPTAWVAVKMLERDRDIMENALLSADQKARIDEIIADYEENGRQTYPEIDSLTLVVSARYGAVERLIADSHSRFNSDDYGKTTAAIDRVVTNKYLAFPLFFIVLAVMFWVTFGPIGTFLTGLMEALVNDVIGAGAKSLMSWLEAPAWLSSLVSDGVIAGVGGVLVFLPQILLIFLFLSILEDSGYMSRAAFITDRPLRRLGLSGRSFIPMLMGFGCTTTAVIAARGVENERDKRMTILLTPYMSCGARLPVYGLFGAAFFARNKGLVVFSLYLLGILIMILCGVLLRRTVFREGDTPFLMELPQYRVPAPTSVLRRLWDRAKDFLTRAGTLIFAMSVLIWFLQSFSPTLHMVADSEESLFGRLGMLIAPVFRPLGFGEWKKSVALLSGLIAKEAVVSTLQVLYAAADSGALTQAVANAFTPLQAYSFLVFILLYTPCVAALAAMRRELNSRKYFIMGIIMQLGVAWIVTFIVYNIGRLLGL